MKSLLVAALCCCILAISAAGGAELVPLQYRGDGEILDVDQSASLVAVAAGYGVELLESTPAGFVPLSRVDFDEQVSQVLIHGDALYAGVLRRGLQAVDISDPSAPVVTGEVLTTGGWRELEATGDVIVGYTTGWGWNVFIGDASDPLHPVAADSLSLENSQSGFALGDGYFYFTSSNDHLQTWSVADPYNAVRTDQYTVGDPRWTRLTVSGDLLWAHGENLTAFSLADPSAPSPLSVVAEDYLLFPEAAASGQHLYRSLSADVTDVVVYDYAVPTAPVAVDTLDGVFVSGLERTLHATQGELLLSAGAHLQRYDLADPSSPVADAAFQEPETLDLAGEDGRGWIASGPAGLSLLEIGPGGTTAWSGPWSQFGRVQRVAVDGDRLALVDAQAVRLLDIADPADPMELQSYPASAIDVDLEDGILVYTAGESAWVVDIASPATPVEFPLGGEVGRVELESGHAYVVSAADLVTNIDLSVPAAPVRVGAVPLPGVSFPILSLMDLTADGGLLVVGGFAQPDCVIDIADPAAPAFLAHSYVDLDFGADQTRSVALSGRWLLVGMGATAHLVDLDDPLDPTDISGPVLASSEATTWASAQVPVCGGSLGSVVFGPVEPGPTSAPSPTVGVLGLSIAPNPANPRVIVAWEMPRRGHLRVEIFDLAGRRVAILQDEGRGEGPGSVAWNGTDSDGRSARSGVYLVRVQAAGLVETSRVTLIR